MSACRSFARSDLGGSDIDGNQCSCGMSPFETDRLRLVEDVCLSEGSQVESVVLGEGLSKTRPAVASLIRH